MTPIPITHLFNAYDLQVNPLEEDKIRSQEVVNYCEARFRVALQAMMRRSEQDQRLLEMDSAVPIFCFSYHQFGSLRYLLYLSIFDDLLVVR